VAVAILVNRRRAFLVRRSRHKPLPGQWEFPGGKVEVGETPVAALRRELHEELGLRVGRLDLFGANAHLYDLPEGPVHYVLLAFRAAARDGAWSWRGRWMDARALARSKVVEGSQPFVSDLLARDLVR
jgi:8-oxo-dGTP diphosphatase